MREGWRRQLRSLEGSGSERGWKKIILMTWGTTIGGFHPAEALLVLPSFPSYSSSCSYLGFRPNRLSLCLSVYLTPLALSDIFKNRNLKGFVGHKSHQKQKSEFQIARDCRGQNGLGGTGTTLRFSNI